jgi:hypothetical protein
MTTPSTAREIDQTLPHLSDRDTITNIIAWVDSRIEAEVKHRPDVNVYKRILSDTWSQVRRHLISLRSEPADPPAAWRCFHCDESFLDQMEATQHFGSHQRHSPACQIDIAEYRAMEERMERYNEEDSDMHRQLHRMENDHVGALVREEEKGYARGVADGAPYLAEREATIAAERAEVVRLKAECEKLRAGLQWIAKVNAMDYEYQARARAALATPTQGKF